MGKIVSLDIAVLHYINHGLSNRWLDFAMPLVTLLGSVYFVLLFSLFLALSKKPKHVALVSIIYGVNTLTFEVLKHLVGRERPFMRGEVLLRVPELLTTSGNPFSVTTPSFPSGHAATAFMLATIMAYYAKSYRAVFYLLAAAVGVSRIYLGVHYPSDVVVGLLLGTATAWLCMRSGYFRSKLLRENGAPSAAPL